MALFLRGLLSFYDPGSGDNRLRNGWRVCDAGICFTLLLRYEIYLRTEM